MLVLEHMCNKYFVTHTRL